MTEYNNHMIACHECDLLINLSTTVDHDKSFHCPRCHHKIQSGHYAPLDSVLALSVTALILLAIANLYPFLAFEAQGQGHSIGLFQASKELFIQGFPLVAILVFGFITALPMIYLMMLIILTVPVKLGLAWRPPAWFGLIVHGILPWAMSEVFLVGVLIALIKMVSMATIILGFSFWAYVAFAITFTYITGVADIHRVWEWLDRSGGSTNV